MKILRGTVILLVLIMVVWPLWAQQPEWCGEFNPVAEHPLSWEKIKPEVAKYLEKGEYEGAYRFILDLFDYHYGQHFKEQKQVDKFHEAVHEYIELCKRQGDSPEHWKNKFIIDRKKPPREQYALLAPDGKIEELTVPCTEFEQDQGKWESPLVAIAYAAYGLRRTSASSIQLAMKAAAKQTSQVYKSYKNWLFNGLAMWPWEMKLNEALVEDGFSTPAPSWQLTFLRPNLSAIIHFEDFEDSELDYGLTIEPIGFVCYKNGSDYRKWWGVSPIITVSGDNGAGYGAAIRYENFVLGAAYHDRGNDVLWYLSIDLYKYLLGDKGKITKGMEFIDKYESKLFPKSKEGS